MEAERALPTAAAAAGLRGTTGLAASATGDDSSKLEAALKEAPPQVARPLIQFAQGQSVNIDNLSNFFTLFDPAQRQQVKACVGLAVLFAAVSLRTSWV